jgi:DNA-binding CsgD family transcriptional regulator
MTLKRQQQIETIMTGQTFDTNDNTTQLVSNYAQGIAAMEQVVVVVSDLKYNRSNIYHGSFAVTLGLSNTTQVSSIWEHEILSLMSPDEQEEKYMAELRFYNELRHLPRAKRNQIYLASKLRFSTPDNRHLDILHRMYYVYEDNCDVVRFAVCIYGPLTFDFHGKSVMINALSGDVQALTSASDSKILSKREKQVLLCVERGLTSVQIADKLAISKFTVSRHRQGILAKLQVRNSTEACQRAHSLGII